MSQCARVALWVPTNDNAPGDGVQATNVPRPADEAIPTQFTAAGGGSGGSVSWASDAEVIAGTEALKAISPETLRNEMAREFAIPEANFANAIAISVSNHTAANGNMLMKTNAAGGVDSSFLPPVIDAGTY